MKVTFLGVGEAFDKNYANSSSLVSTGQTNLLLDCGYSVPQQLWKYEEKHGKDSHHLDGVYVSHCHADHCFGLPAILQRMWEDGRTKPLKIICQRGWEKRIEEIVTLGYPGFTQRYDYVVRYVEVTPEVAFQFDDLTLNFAPTNHSISNLAIKVSDGTHSMCYSGDGMFCGETERLYQDADLVVQESYLFDKEIIGHANAKQTIAMARRRNISCVALTHLNRNFRLVAANLLQDELAGDKPRVIIPEPMSTFEFRE